MGLSLLGPIMDTEGLQASERLTLIECAYRADRNGVIRVAQTEIARSCGLSRRTVATHIAYFEGCYVLKRMGHGRYAIDRAKLDDLPYWLGYAERADKLDGSSTEYLRR